MFLQEAFLQLENFAIHNKFILKVYLKYKFDIKVCVNWINIRKKKLLKVKYQIEVFAYGAYMFGSLQSFNDSQMKLTSCFLCQTYS